MSTTTGRARPSRAGRRRPGVARALGALLVLILLVVGIPVALVVFAPPWRGPGPSWSTVTSFLTRPDDGRVFLAALTAVAWVAWTSFAATVVLEVVSMVRGLPTPRLPLVAAPQKLAASLVAAAVMLLAAPNGIASSPTPRPVAQEIQPWESGTTRAGSPNQGRMAPAQDAVRLHAAADAPPTVDDGADSATDRRAHHTPLAQLAQPVATAMIGDAQARSITVARGDTLWDLAATHLGDGTRFREIARLNYGRPQPDGRVLTDAHWIYPGWVLQLPPRRPAAQGESTALPAAGKPQAPSRPPIDSTPAAEAPAGSAVPAPVQSASPAPAHSTAPETATEAGKPAPRENGASETATTSEAPSPWILGVPGIAAAGLVFELARRRRRQQQRRAPGQRIPRPVGEPSDVERILRGVQAPVSLNTVTAALNQLAEGCQANESPLPRVIAVLVGRDDMHVILPESSAEEVPIAPFVRAQASVLGAAVCWRLNPDLREEPTDGEASLGATTTGIPAYPALVTLGTVGDRMLLLNLEAAGTLDVVGDPGPADEVLRTLAVELATSPLSAASTLIVSDSLRTLADVSDPDRVAAVDSVAGRLRAQVRIAAVRRALDRDALRDVHDARADMRAHDTWTPEVYVGVDTDARPWAGGIAVNSSRETGEAGGARSGWQLQLLADGPAHLLELGVELVPARLTDAAYASFLELLAVGTQEPRDPVSDEGQASEPDTEDSLVEFPPTTEAHVEGQPVVVAAHQAPVRLRSRRHAVLAALPEPPVSGDRAGSRAPGLAPNSPGGTDRQAPRILLLGRIDVVGAATPGTPRRGRSLELLAYLCLHPGATPAEIDEALWPGERATADMRNSLMSRTRTWLGTHEDGEPFLSNITPTGGYRLHPAVSSDWHDFLELSRRGLRDVDNSVGDLERALGLVRARPFLGIDPATFSWAEADAQEMLSSIVDVVHEVADRLDSADDTGAARAALALGLTVDPSSESLHYEAMQLAARLGDRAELDRLAARLREQLQAVDPTAALDQRFAALLNSGAAAANS